MIPDWKRKSPSKGTFQAFFNIDKAGFGRCLEPSFSCNERPIRIVSHGVVYES